MFCDVEWFVGTNTCRTIYYMSLRLHMHILFLELKLKHKMGRKADPHSHHKFRAAAFLQQAKKKLTDEEVHHYIISMFGKFMKMRRWKRKCCRIFRFTHAWSAIGSLHSLGLAADFIALVRPEKMSLNMHSSHCIFYRDARTVSTFLQSKLWK